MWLKTYQTQLAQSSAGFKLHQLQGDIFVWVFPKIMGKPPKSSILIEFSIIFTIHFGGKLPLFLVQHPYGFSWILGTLGLIYPHGTNGIFTYMNGWLSMVNVGKYTSHMDPMGYVSSGNQSTYCWLEEILGMCSTCLDLLQWSPSRIRNQPPNK